MSSAKVFTWVPPCLASPCLTLPYLASPCLALPAVFLQHSPALLLHLLLLILPTPSCATIFTTRAEACTDLHTEECTDPHNMCTSTNFQLIFTVCTGTNFPQQCVMWEYCAMSSMQCIEPCNVQNVQSKRARHQRLVCSTRYNV